MFDINLSYFMMGIVYQPHPLPLLGRGRRGCGEVSQFQLSLGRNLLLKEK